jgi:excisionase family DNA binding protein
LISSLYRVKEVAKILKVKPTTIRRWCKSGMLRAKKIGKSWYIPEEELILFKNEENEIRIMDR